MKNITKDLLLIPVSIKEKIQGYIKNSASRKAMYKVLILLIKKSKAESSKEVEFSQTDFEKDNTDYKKPVDNLIKLGVIERNDKYNPHTNTPKSYVLNF